MTETAWLKCADSGLMLEHVAAFASGRKLRLFASAACRHVWQPIADSRCLTMLETSDRFADRLASKEELQEAGAAIAQMESTEAIEAVGDPSRLLLALWALSDADKGIEATEAILEVSGLLLRGATHSLEEDDDGYYSALLRDLFGVPSRPVKVRRTWLEWRDSTIPKLAQAIYDERAFDRLPILADALEDAGCTDVDILKHCREPGEHVRGCWVVDALLGKS
jgi:hypothetical protein